MFAVSLSGLSVSYADEFKWGKVSHPSGHRKGNLVTGRIGYVASDVDGVGPVQEAQLDTLVILTLVILCQPMVG
jgi:hypothetical protein